MVVVVVEVVVVMSAKEGGHYGYDGSCGGGSCGDGYY